MGRREKRLASACLQRPELTILPMHVIKFHFPKGALAKCCGFLSNRGDLGPTETSFKHDQHGYQRALNVKKICEESTSCSNNDRDFPP